MVVWAADYNLHWVPWHLVGGVVLDGTSRHDLRFHGLPERSALSYSSRTMTDSCMVVSDLRACGSEWEWMSVWGSEWDSVVVSGSGWE